MQQQQTEAVQKNVLTEAQQRIADELKAGMLKLTVIDGEFIYWRNLRLRVHSVSFPYLILELVEKKADYTEPRDLVKLGDCFNWKSMVLQVKKVEDVHMGLEIADLTPCAKKRFNKQRSKGLHLKGSRTRQEIERQLFKA